MAHPYGFWVVDQIDDPPLLNAASRTIPGNASPTTLEIVDALEDTVYGISVGDGIGYTIGLYVGQAGSERLAIQFGGPFPSIQPCLILRGERVSIRRMDSASDITSGELGINFLGGQA